jgi:hypothetical protein
MLRRTNGPNELGQTPMTGVALSSLDGLLVRVP